MSEELSASKPSRTEVITPKSVASKVVLSIAVLGGGVFAFIFSQLLAAVLVSVILAGIFGFSTSKIDALFDNNVVLLLMYIISSLLLVGILIIVCTIAKKKFLNLAGLARKPQWSDAAWALLAYGAYFIIFAIVAAVFLPLFQEVIDVDQQQNLGVSFDRSAINAVVLFVMFVIIPPLIEEILFRGFMYRSVRKWIPKWLALIIVSVLFGAMHLELLSEGSPNWIAMIDTTVLSVVLIILVEKTNSLWPAVYVHALKNLVAFSLLFAGLGI